MSQTVTEVYDAFRAANVQEDLAKAAAAAIAGREDLATKLKAAIADLTADPKLLKFGYGPAILGLLIKLVFFP